MVKNETKSKSIVATALIAIFVVIILFIAVNVSAQGIQVITYGDSPQQTTSTTPTQTTQAPITNSNNIIINQYSADYLFSIGAQDQSPKVCLCSSIYDKVYITNTAPVDATFTIITNIPEYAKLPFSTVKISAGQTLEIPVLISADCAMKDGSKDYNILVSNNLGTQYTIERSLNVQKCQSISATLYTSATQINPCDQVNYTIELKNPAPFTEQYTITPRNPELFNNLQYQVTLESGQITYLNFSYKPLCSTYGTDAVSFDIKSINNNLKGTLTQNLIINRAYDFNVATPNQVQLCRGDAKDIQIKVKNLAAIQNDFTLSLVNAPDFLVLQNGLTTMNPGEEKTFIVTANPTKSTKATQTLTFDVKTKLGDLSQQYTVPISINTCYGLEINIISDNNPKLCSGTYVYDVEVQNKGFNANNITLTTNSANAEIFPTHVVVGAGMSKNVTLALSLPDVDTKRMSFVVNAKTEGEQATAQDTLTVGVQKKYECTLLEFGKNKIYARYGTDNVSFTITNKGNFETKYYLTYEGSDWINLETESITLKPDETKPVLLSLYSDNSEPRKEYNFKINATSENNGQVYENNMKLIMTHTPLIEKMWSIATGTPCAMTTSILLILFALGIIAIILLSWKRVRVPLAFKVIALGLIVLIIVLVLVMRGLPESRYPPIDKTQVNNSHIIMYENHKYTAKLQGGYFYDPDNDTLTFSVMDMPKNITINIVGNKAVIIPDKNWVGTARIKFTAKDNYGGEVDSGRVEIEVIEVPKFNWGTWYFNNCVYINAILLILFLALILLLRTRKEKAAVSRKVHFAGIKKEKGFLYFVDKDGDVSRAPMARSNKKNQKFTKTKVGRSVAIKKKRR